MRKLAAGRRLEDTVCALLLAGVLTSGAGVTPAMALSLFDVVQMVRAGYSDREILDLLEVTEAQFALDAAAITTLKKEGVSETVIQALIRASAVEGASGTADTESAGDAREPPDEERRHSETHGVPRPAAAAPAPVSGEEIPQALGPPAGGAPSFAAVAFDEEGGSHQGSHQHFALAVAGVPAIVLRSEAGYRSVQARAQAMAARLEQAVHGAGGEFLTASRSSPAVWYAPAGGTPVEVLPVSRGDVIAYQRRSVGPVTAERLAAYWAALLDDFSRVFVFGQAPAQLSGLHIGRVLAVLHDDLGARAGSAESGQEAANLPAAVDRLNAEDKEHLIELPRRVPAEFGTRQGGHHEEPH